MRPELFKYRIAIEGPGLTSRAYSLPQWLSYPSQIQEQRRLQTSSKPQEIELAEDLVGPYRLYDT